MRNHDKRFESADHLRDNRAKALFRDAFLRRSDLHALGRHIHRIIADAHGPQAVQFFMLPHVIRRLGTGIIIHIDNLNPLLHNRAVKGKRTAEVQ